MPAPMLPPPVDSAEVMDTPQPTFGARLLMLGQRVEGWARLRLVSQEAACAGGAGRPAQGSPGRTTAAAPPGCVGRF